MSMTNDKEFYQSVIPILNWQADQWEYRDVTFGQIGFRLKFPPVKKQDRLFQFAIAIIQLPTDFKICGEIYAEQGRYNLRWIQEEFFDVAFRDENLSNDELLERFHLIANERLSRLIEKKTEQENSILRNLQ